MGIKKKAVAVIIENDQGQILLLKRGKLAQEHFGKWENLGGSVEEGETDETALRREVKEEIGVELVNLKNLFTQESDNWIVNLYMGNIDGQPKIQDLNENSDMKWYAKSDLKDLDLASYTRSDFERLKFFE